MRGIYVPINAHGGVSIVGNAALNSACGCTNQLKEAGSGNLNESTTACRTAFVRAQG